jgi:hypothetical protein
MFNLEQSIAEWRRQMLAAGIKTPVPLEELEIHLREEIEQQMKSGLSEAEAFTASVRKIGHAQTVQSEFKKIDASRELIRFIVNNLGIVLMFFGFGTLGIALMIITTWDELLQHGHRKRAMLSFTLFATLVVLNKVLHGTLHVFIREPLPSGLWVVIVVIWLAFLIGHFRQWRKNRSFTSTLT